MHTGLIFFLLCDWPWTCAEQSWSRVLLTFCFLHFKPSAKSSHVDLIPNGTLLRYSKILTRSGWTTPQTCRRTRTVEL
ncbi:hypothetical protein BJ878DRAFT_5453 [Calycina marina]|uniref:Secreted protein n=1 Tax=Calycina marina TaxID=1763456 RepID=A0A9P8CIS9_9HELO|nr:hypothetical protein BJ878DRAFT_5453 [Calycina marina]